RPGPSRFDDAAARRPGDVPLDAPLAAGRASDLDERLHRARGGRQVRRQKRRRIHHEAVHDAATGREDPRGAAAVAIQISTTDNTNHTDKTWRYFVLSV